MMRLTYPICCGLDVHQKLIVVTIVTTKGQKTDKKASQIMTYLLSNTSESRTATSKQIRLKNQNPLVLTKKQP